MTKAQASAQKKALTARLKSVLSNKENFIARGTDFPLSMFKKMTTLLKLSLSLKEKSWFLINEDETKVLWGPKDRRIDSVDVLNENINDLIIRFSPERGTTWDDLNAIEDDREWLRAMVPSIRFATADLSESDKVW